MQRSGEWIPFGPKKFLRNLPVYEDLEFEFEFTDVRFAAIAPYGGPLAFVLSGAPSSITVLNAAGKHLFHTDLPSDAGEIEALGWSHEEALVVLTSKPGCFVWVSNRRAFHSVKLPRNCLATGLQLAIVGSVAAVLVGHGSAVCISFPEKKEPIVTESDVPLHTVLCADVLPAALSEADRDVIYLGGSLTSGKRKNVHTICTFSPDEPPIESGAAFPSAVKHLQLSPNGIHVAIALADGVVLVCPSDLGAVTKRIDTAFHKEPVQLKWCGSTFLHLQYSIGQFSDDPFEVGHVSIILPAIEPTTHKEVLKWDLEGSGVVFACTEIDGVRILSERANYFIEVVPQCLIDIFSHGSKSKVAALCQAAAAAASGTLEGIAALRTLTENASDLYEVLDSVVAAAASEFSQSAQENLLSVVAVTTSQGRVITKYDSDAFVDVCRRLRFFNNIRNANHCAVPISHAQYLALSGSSELRQIQPREAQVIVDRLVQRGDFQWAVNVANFLGMKIDKVLVHWSVFRVISADDEAAVHGDIVATLRQCPGAGFTEAALEAAALGKQRLAVQLLDSEPRSQSQVLLLLQMGLDEIAMEKAVASHDADLTYLVLLKLKHHMPEPNFFAALNRFEIARMQFLFASQHSPTLATTAAKYLIDARSERHVAAVKIANAFQPESVSAAPAEAPASHHEGEEGEDAPLPDLPTAPMEEADVKRSIAGTDRVTVDLMNELATLYRASESTQDEARLCDLHRALLKEQDKLIAETHDTDICNMTLVDTVKYCIKNGMEDRAEALRKQFEMPEKKYWFAKLMALCDSEQWEAVERMGGVGRNKPVKSPIGFLPFVEALADKKQPEKAAAFVPKLPSVIQRVEWFVKLDEFQMAVDAAYEEESIDLLQQIRRRAHNPSILQYIDERVKALQ